MVFVILLCLHVVLKANKTQGCISCIVISVYPLLDIPSIKKATEYRNT